MAAAVIMRGIGIATDNVDDDMVLRVAFGKVIERDTKIICNMSSESMIVFLWSAHSPPGMVAVRFLLRHPRWCLGFESKYIRLHE